MPFSLSITAIEPAFLEESAVRLHPVFIVAKQGEKTSDCIDLAGVPPPPQI
jgi:hypothetical protein